MTAATASGMAPRWTGMCSAWTIMRPARSKSAVEQSRRSLMFEENAERTSAAPISSAIARSELPITWSSTGITSSAPGRACPTRWSPPPSRLRSSRSRRRAPRAPDRSDGPEDRLPADRGPRSTVAVRTATSSTCRDAVGVAVALLVRAVEALRKLGPQIDGELERLTAVPQACLAFARQLARLLERDDERPNRVATRVARDEPERGENPCGAGHEHRGAAQLVGERARVQRAGAAEGDEREVPRIVATLDRHDPQRPQHLGVHDVDDVGRVDVPERARRGVAVELEPAREPLREPAEEQVGVGHRRLLSAPAVTGRPGNGACAAGADAQGTTSVPPGDGPAACPDRVDVDHRYADREPGHVTAFRAARAATGDQADVGRRAAHVEGDRVPDSTLGSDALGRHDPRGGSREEDQRRVRSGFLDRRDPA